MASSKTTMPLLAQYHNATDVESAFYEALREGDLDHVMACFALDDHVFCIHGDGMRVMGREPVRDLFDAILGNGPLRITTERVHVIEMGDTAIHSLVERVELLGSDGPTVGFLRVTNVYQKTTMGWRLVCHHASSGTTRELEDVVGSPIVLH
jgi:ketosteroid isomerase-like protein